MGVEIDRATSESAAKSERLGKAWARKKHLSEPGIVVGTILNFIVPLDLLNHVLLLGRIVVDTVAFVVGLAMVIGANRIFRDLGTNVRPSQPTPVLATKGMYTWTRNLMYVGGGIALLGIAIDYGLDGFQCSWLLVARSCITASSYVRALSGKQVWRRIPALQDQVPGYWWRF